MPTPGLLNGNTFYLHEDEERICLGGLHGDSAVIELNFILPILLANRKAISWLLGNVPVPTTSREQTYVKNTFYYLILAFAPDTQKKSL